MVGVDVRRRHKKLERAATLWAGGALHDTEGYEKDLESFGMTRDQVADFVGPGSGDFEVFPENWDAVQVFMACATQWRVSDHRAVGLDYNGLLAVMQLRDTQERRDTFERVRILESAALKEFARKRR